MSNKEKAAVKKAAHKAYSELKKAGTCVKCGKRPGHEGGSVCAYCREMAHYYRECKEAKKPFSRENFARTEAAKAAEKGILTHGRKQAEKSK